MAKATAICTCKTCGNHFTKEAYKQNRSQADSWIEWAVDHYDICPECEDKARKEQAAEYAKEASEGGLPTLSGTEKQITWAEKIRHDKIGEINELLQDAISKEKDDLAEKIEMTMNFILTKDQARWWIDNRDWSTKRLLSLNFKDAQEAEMEKTVKNPERKEEDDTVITPENAQYGTAEIVVSEDRVETHYPKDDTFRKIAKESGFSWDSNGRCWVKQITAITGSAADRAAEVSNKLLSAGFSVKCKDADVRRKAIDGDFEPECKRWVKLRMEGDYEGWLSIVILRDDADSQELYDAARKIKGSKWSSGAVVVPVAQHALVEDFCGIYGYKISGAPRQAIEKYESAHTITPKAPADPEKKDVLGDILKSSSEVLTDLKDED